MERALPLASMLLSSSALLLAACPTPGPQGLAVPDAGSPINCARVFLTSSTSHGDFGSATGAPLEKADFLCQAAASKAGLTNPASFKAYLSAGSVNAADRLTFDGPYCATAAHGQIGRVLFSSRTWEAGSLFMLDTDESAQSIPSPYPGDEFSGSCGWAVTYNLRVPYTSFWFGSDALGHLAPETCSGWASQDSNFCAVASRAAVGFFDATPQLDSQTAPCSLMLHLLCFEAK